MSESRTQFVDKNPPSCHISILTGERAELTSGSDRAGGEGPPGLPELDTICIL